jgi:hypothetical protein
VVSVDRQKQHPHIAILPSALYNGGCDVENLPVHHGIYVIPYSDHSSYEELVTFISQLKPAKIHPIINETKVDEKKILSSQELMKTFSTIPQRLYELCRKRKTKHVTCQNKEQTVHYATENLTSLPSQMSHEIRQTKPVRKPGITWNKKLSKASEKKGVHFDSSFTPEENGETSQTDMKHTRESEREEVIIRTSKCTCVRVKIPHNVKNNLLDVQVKLFDISTLWKDVAGNLSQLNASNHKAFLRDLPCMFNRDSPSEGRDVAASYRAPHHCSDGRTSPSENMDTTSEGLGNFLPTHDSENSFQDLSLSYAMYIKDVTVKSENLSDTDSISVGSVSTVIAPQTVFSCKNEKEANKDTIDIKEHFGEMDSVSVKEEDIHQHGIYSDCESEDLPRGTTEDMWKNAMVIFHSDSDSNNRFWESSESDNAVEKSKTHCMSDPTKSCFRRRWKKPAGCQSFDECTPFISSTQKAITKQSPRPKKRNRGDTEPVDRDSDSSSSTDADFLEPNTTSKRSECSNKQNDVSPDNHCLPHPWCPSYINGIDASKENARNDQATLNSGCKCNSDKACHDRLGTVADYMSEPNVQQSHVQTESCSQISLAPTLLSCSVVQSLANKNQIVSGPGTQSKKNDNAILAEECRSNMRKSNIDQDVENGETSTYSRNITFNKEVRTTSRICNSESFEESQQAVASFGLSENDRDSTVPCNTTCNMVEGPVNSQSTELSFHTSTTSEEGVNSSVTRSLGVVCLSENSRANPALEQSDLFSTADERIREFHVKCTENNSNISQAKQFSDNRDTLHADQQQYDIGIQCELFSGSHPSCSCCSKLLPASGEIHANKDSTNIPSQNSARITNLLQDVEAFITEPGGIKSDQSDESEEINAGRRKQTSSKLTFELGKKSDVSCAGSKICTESNSSTDLIIDNAHVDKSYNCRQRSSCENAGPKNETAFTNEILLHNNKDYATRTAVQSTVQNAAIVISDKLSQNYKNIRDVRNIHHSSRDSNRTLISESEASVCPESHIICNSSVNNVDCNYWANGNRTPFAMVEVFLAARKLSFQEDMFPTVATHPFHCHASETFSSADEDGNCQQTQSAASPPVLNLKNSIQQGRKQLKMPLSTQHPECTYKCSSSKHTITEQHVGRKWREINCSDIEETHIIPDKARPVSDSVSSAVKASPGRLNSRDRFSDSNRSSNRDKTDNCISSVPLHLYSVGESFMGLRPCSTVSNTGTTYEEMINGHGTAPNTEGSGKMAGESIVASQIIEGLDDLDKNGAAYDTPEGSHENRTASKIPRLGDLPGQCDVICEMSERSDDMLGEIGVASQIPEGSDDFLGEFGVVPETSEEADDLLGECRVVPDTSEISDLLDENGVASYAPEGSGGMCHKNGVALETPEESGHLLGNSDYDIAPNTSNENTGTTEMYSSSETMSLSTLRGTFQDDRKEACEESMQTKRSKFLDLMQRRTQSSNEVLQSNVTKQDECLEKLGTIKRITVLKKHFDNFIKRAIMNDHIYCKTVQRCQIYFNGKHTSLDEYSEQRCMLDTVPIFNRFCSTSGVSDSSNLCQNPDGMLHQFNRNELSSPGIFQVEEVKSELPDDSFAESNVAEGNAEERKCTEVYEISDDMFPSDRVMHVTKTYGRTKRSQDSSRCVIQTSQSLYTSSKNTSSKTDNKQWKSHQICTVTGKTEVKKSAAQKVFQNQSHLSIMPPLRQYKRKHKQSSSEYSSSVCKHRRVSDAT